MSEADISVKPSYLSLSSLCEHLLLFKQPGKTRVCLHCYSDVFNAKEATARGKCDATIKFKVRPSKPWCILWKKICRNKTITSSRKFTKSYYNRIKIRTDIIRKKKIYDRRLSHSGRGESWPTPYSIAQLGHLDLEYDQAKSQGIGPT